MKEVLGEAIKKNKIKLLIILIITTISLFTGIILVIKTQSLDAFTNVFGGEDDLAGTSFFLRLLSMLVVLGFVILGSLNIWLCPFALLFIGYRAFLLGGNITLLIIFNGLSGLMVGLLVVLPCQLICLATFILLFLLLCEGRNCKKCYGSERVKNYWLWVIFVGVLLLVVICLIESLFIYIVSPKIVFVF